MTEYCKTNPLCECQQALHEPRFVVLTGGPGAGKTAILEIVKKSFCEHVTVLPEAASIIFGGGFWRRDTLPAREGAQRAIFSVEIELERIIREEKLAAVALCDRGTIDGLAYWPGSVESFWKENGSSRQAEFDKYSAVIHLRTPAVEHGYNLSNPVRVESAVRAAEIDEKILKAWSGHPRRVVIESSEDFLNKVQAAVDEIKKVLPRCCADHTLKHDLA